MTTLTGTAPNPGPFRKADVEGLTTLLATMFNGGFAYLFKDAEIATNEYEGDMLHLMRHGYTVLRIAKSQTVKTLLGPRSTYRVAYEVYATVCTARETRWQPADYDDKKLTTVYSLDEAVAAIVHAEMLSALACHRESEQLARDYASLTDENP